MGTKFVQRLPCDPVRTPHSRGGWGEKELPLLLAELMRTVSVAQIPNRLGFATTKLLKSNLVNEESQHGY